MPSSVSDPSEPASLYFAGKIRHPRVTRQSLIFDLELTAISHLSEPNVAHPEQEMNNLLPHLIALSNEVQRAAQRHANPFRRTRGRRYGRFPTMIHCTMPRDKVHCNVQNSDEYTSDIHGIDDGFYAVAEVAHIENYRYTVLSMFVCETPGYFFWLMNRSSQTGITRTLPKSAILQTLFSAHANDIEEYQKGLAFFLTENLAEHNNA
jgi:hypothetical protein